MGGVISKQGVPERICAGTIIATLAVLALIATPAAQAAPPANDQAPGAELLPGSSFPVLSSTWDITEATFTNDPVTTCTSDDDHGIWFKITPNLTGTYRVWAAAEGPTATTVDDTVMGIFTTPDFATFTEIACDDESATNEPSQSIITTTLDAGTQYYIYVSKFGFNDPVQPPPDDVVQIKIDSFVPPPPPPNDTSGGAELLGGSSFPVLSGTYDITDATSTGDPPLPSCRFGTPWLSIWFKITPDLTGTYRTWAAADGPTATTVNDPVMAAYTSAGGAAGPFTEVACDEDSATTESLQSMTTTTLNGGTEYWIVVWNSGTPLLTAGNSSVQIKVDRLALAPTPPPAGTQPTGQRAAALKKCKKKKGKARAKCKRKAKKLPV